MGVGWCKSKPICVRTWGAHVRNTVGMCNLFSFLVHLICLWLKMCVWNYCHSQHFSPDIRTKKKTGAMRPNVLDKNNNKR